MIQNAYSTKSQTVTEIERRTCPLTAIKVLLSNPLTLRSKGADNDEGLLWLKSRVPDEERKGLQLQRNARIIQGTYLISRLESPATSNIQWKVAVETTETCVSPRQMIYAPDNNDWRTTRLRVQQRRLARNIFDHSSTSRTEKSANNPANEYQRSQRRGWQQRYKYEKENKRVTHTRKIKCQRRIETRRKLNMKVSTTLEDTRISRPRKRRRENGPSQLTDVRASQSWSRTPDIVDLDGQRSGVFFRRPACQTSDNILSHVTST
jgi:hypothetical protein